MPMKKEFKPLQYVIKGVSITYSEITRKIVYHLPRNWNGEMFKNWKDENLAEITETEKKLLPQR
jgi:hypothetical protein